MATFTYKALDAEARRRRARSTHNKSAVAASLRNKASPSSTSTRVKSSLAHTDIFASMQRIQARDLTIFSRQFATMINSVWPCCGR